MVLFVGLVSFMSGSGLMVLFEDLLHYTSIARAQLLAKEMSYESSQKTTLRQTIDHLRVEGGRPWDGNIPGIAATVIPANVLGDDLITVVSGYSDLATKTRLQADSAFHIGSITKTFTAALILQLCQEGTLSLQDSMSTWIDGFSYGTDVTVEMLLSHTSGIPDFVSLSTQGVALGYYALSPLGSDLNFSFS